MSWCFPPLYVHPTSNKREEEEEEEVCVVIINSQKYYRVSHCVSGAYLFWKYFLNVSDVLRELTVMFSKTLDFNVYVQRNRKSKEENNKVMFDI